MADLYDTIVHLAARLAPGRYSTWLNVPDVGVICPDGTLLGPGESCGVVEWVAPYELRKLHAVWTRTYGSTPAQDVALTTHHFLNLTSDVPDATWATADYTQVETAFTALWTAIKNRWAPSTKLSELRWYADGPAFKPRGSLSSPLIRATTVNAAGTGAGVFSLPPQAAVSVTEVTTSRYSTVAREGRPSQLRHRWGRFYLPAPATGALGAAAGEEGRLASATQTIIADAVQTFYNACRAGNQLVPVLYSPTTGHSWSVDEIHVDDIFDVVRSRRFDTPLSRAARTLAALS